MPSINTLKLKKFFLWPLLSVFLVMLLLQVARDTIGITSHFWMTDFNLKTSGQIIESKYVYVGGKYPQRYYSVKYTYSVDGERYASDRVGWRDRHNQNLSLLDRYPKDTTVDVFYSKNKPGKSVLENSEPGLLIYFPVFVAVLVYCVVLFFNVYMFKGRRLKNN